MNKYYNKKSIIVLLMFTIVFICMFADLFVYGVNDDTGMRSMALGAYGGRPDAHLQWLPYVSGFVLSRLYMFLPGIDWYGLLLVIIPSSTLIVVFSKFIYGKGINVNTFFWGCIFALCISELLNFQWTTSAAICGGSAIMTYIWSEENKNQLAIFVCLLLCFFIRPYTFYCMFIGLSWALLYRYISGINLNLNTHVVYDVSKSIIFRSFHFLKSIFKWGMPLLMAILLSFLIDKINYGSDEWISYREYCNSRAIVYDYTGVPDYDGNKQFWNTNGFNEETVDMLRMYQIGFLDDVGKEELDLISSYVKTDRELSFVLKDAVGTIISRLTHSSYIFITVPLFLGIIVLFSLRMYRKSFFNAFYMLLNTMFWGFIASYFIYVGKYPDRTEFIVILCMFLNILQTVKTEEYQGVANDSISFSGKSFSVANVIVKKYMTVFVVVILIFSLAKVFYEKIQIRNSKYERNLIGTKIDSYFYDNNGNYYILCDATGIVVTKNFNVFNSSITPSNTVETLGWGIRNPLWINKLELMGGNSINEVIFKENVYLCAYNEERASKIKKYIDNNVTDCDMSEVDCTDFGLHIYKVKVAEDTK